MLQRNGLIAGGIIGAAVLIAALVAYIGQPSADGGSFDKGQRFTAAPGTTRENAMLLTSAHRAIPKTLSLARRITLRTTTIPSR